jgi:HNH endonuclease
MREYQLYKNEKFHLQTTGRYFQSGNKDANERLLHRRVWSDLHGPIPDGHDIHHRDGDWRNNHPDNLEAVPSSQHQRAHMLAYNAIPENYARSLAGLAKAREEAPKWHRSKEGRAWHKEHGKALWINRVKKELQCKQCGKKYETYFPTRSSFCSNNCAQKAKWHSREHFTDNRKCKNCGTTFSANKYRAVRFCSRSCAMRSRMNP